jgi:uncharacterized membrane protein
MAEAVRFINQGERCSMKFGFYKKYAILSIGLFVVEICIALFINDRLIRPFIGDMLVVILIFSICRSVIKVNHFRLALCVLFFALAVEIGQYFNMISILGLQQNELAGIIIGTTFDFHDLLAYTAGILLILMIELLAKHYSGRQLVPPNTTGIYKSGETGE